MRVSRFSSVRFLASCLLGLSLLSPLSGPAWAASGKEAVIQKEALPKKPNREIPRVLDVVIDKSVPVLLDAPASTIFIANPDVADVQVVTPTRIMVLGKQTGETTLLVSDEKGQVLAQRSVIVTPNLSELRQALRAISPDSAIKVESVPNGLILSGEVATAAVGEEARRIAARYIAKNDSDIINRMRVKANNQIQIRVRFAEVSRDADKRFGIDWETVGQVGSFTLGLATGADFITAGATAITRTTMGSDTNDAFATSFNNNHFSVNGMIDALAKDGLVTILAEPSLTALSGETASFLAGGEFPIPVPQSSDTITIEWKQYGVSLAFTPTIIGENRINLHVRPEVSQLTDVGSITLNNVAVPALTTRRAETTIELNSGQSFALAGLLNSQQNQSVSKFPFLGDMPVLGPLFRSTRFQNNESELVIIITPYIVKPSSQEKLALPTDGFSPPSDTDMFFRMRQTNSDPAAPTLSGKSRAVKVEEPQADEAPLPVSAPVSRVKAEPIKAKAAEPEETATPVSLPISTPAKAKAPKASKEKTRTEAAPSPAAPSGPVGPGGFIME